MKRRFCAILAAMIVAASLSACNGGKEEDTTTGDKININQEQTTDNSSENTTSGTEDNTENTETPIVDKNSDPGEHSYIQKNDTVYVMNLLNALSFRSGTYEELGGFRNGDALRRIGISEDGRWSKVVVAGVEGYVATRNLTTYSPLDNGFVEHNVTLTADVTLNVRISPTFPEGVDERDDAEVHCNVAGQIFAGNTVTVIAYDEALGWYKIAYTPAEGIVADGYNFEYFVKADASYFVETKEPEPTVEIPEGYKNHSVLGVSFAVPQNFDTSNPTLMIGQAFISVEKTTFSSSYKDDFLTSLTVGQGLNVDQTSVEETTSADGSAVYVVKCVSNPGSSASYDALICIRINETECVNITVTEMGVQTNLVNVIVSTLIVNN